ncbi:MAG TPA: formate dehydrogenase accessory sulfurtransferase FdhD [Bryobacteraceae bacterium]|nr:formate dehydrogenase accessory sulfurtransferase FdhD [Bryobacteraceae bacterium]
MKTVRKRVLRWDGSAWSEAPDELAAEEPLEIRVGSEVVGVTMRTPGSDTELVAGFLLTEGLLRPNAVPILRQDHPNRVTAAIEASVERARRTTTISASCGVCGKASIETVHQHFPPVDDDTRVSTDLIVRLTARMRDAQLGFSRTGGVHAAAIFDAAGDTVVVREDIGRHNATDKAIGHALLQRKLPLSGHTLMVSGRVSFEIVQKALAARIPIVVAVSAPSSLAVEFAEESGQTLAGFLRDGRFNLYTHPHRIVNVAGGGGSLLE